MDTCGDCVFLENGKCVISQFFEGVKGGLLGVYANDRACDAFAEKD